MVDGRFATGLCAGREPQFAGIGGCIRLLLREGGVAGLWSGNSATMARAAALSGGQLATYDHSKVLLLHWGVFEAEGATLHALCAVLSALVAVCTHPSWYCDLSTWEPHTSADSWCS